MNRRIPSLDEFINESKKVYLKDDEYGGIQYELQDDSITNHDTELSKDNYIELFKNLKTSKWEDVRGKSLPAQPIIKKITAIIKKKFPDVVQESVELNESNTAEWFTIKQDASRITFALQSGSKKHVVDALTKCKKVTVPKQWTYIETSFGNVYIERNKENDFLTIQQFFESGTMGDKIIMNIEDLQDLINTIKSADIKKSHTYEIKK